jgi:outer membrane translocation and assembly module TamA
LLATEGYFSPVVKDRIEPDGEKLTAHFEIALGQQTRAGAPYSEQALADFQAALQSSGYFSSVFVSIAADAGRMVLELAFSLADQNSRS